MAKLRIEKANGDLLVDEYVNVVEGLFKKEANGLYENFQEFLDAEPDERPDILQSFVKGNRKITQQIPPNAAGETSEVISGQNCRILTEKDIKRKHKRSRVTVPMPDAPPYDFAYLDSYAKQIHALYSTDKPKCYKFMFGAMMLTRCR